MKSKSKIMQGRHLDQRYRGNKEAKGYRVMLRMRKRMALKYPDIFKLSPAEQEEMRIKTGDLLT